MKLRIIQLGKDKDSWLTEAVNEYKKRLKPFCDFDIVELPDVSIKNTGSREVVIQKESSAILEKIETDDLLVLLNERGEQKTSLEFSSFLANLSCRKRVVFVIGGVYGTGKEVNARADFILGLSKLTFTHRITRLILVEQIYRAMMISAGRNYHI
jgi:23S rRNA (pseudouridine1915-N3)-methyltransferase